MANWKGRVREVMPNLKYVDIITIYAERLKKSTKNCGCSQSWDRHLNTGPPDYKSRAASRISVSAGIK